MKKIIISLCIFLSGCGFNEAWEEIQEKERIQRAERIAKIQKDLAYSYGVIRPRTFYYNGPKSGSQPAYRYIRQIGGSVTDRRAAFFELQVTINVSQRGSDWCRGQVIAKILDRQPPSGAWEVLAQGSVQTSWPRCGSPPERLVSDALAQMS